MKLKLTAVCLALLILLPAGVTKAFGHTGYPAFSDIKGSFAEEQVVDLAARGIIEGVRPGEFRPDDSVSRLQFSLWIAKTLGIQPVLPFNTSFPDLTRGSLAAGYIEALARLGMVKGTGTGGFQPEGPVLRQDAAVLIHQALGGGYERLSVNDKYADQDLIAPYAVEGVAYVTGRGLMTGGGSHFHPLRELTRAEAASLAARLLSARKAQALTAFTELSSQSLYLKTGETRQTESRAAGVLPPFTTVYGLDRPDVFSVTPGGAVAGKQPGAGTVTVNAGYNSYTLKTTVSAPRTRGNASPGVADTVYQDAPETRFDYHYSVRQQAPDTAFQQTEGKSYPGPAGGLTSESDTWTGFLRQQGRDIMVDLKAIRAVSTVSLEFRQNPGWGVWLPGYLKGEVSLDGVHWHHLGQVYHGLNLTDQEVRDVNLTLTFSPVAARYLKISFPVDTWVFARRLSVKGKPDIAAPAILPPAGQDGAGAGNYLQIPNINDILLVYTGDGSDDQNLTPADFLPLVAYQTKNQGFRGSMFDTMLFLPCYGLPSTRESWTAYAADLFAPGRQLQALDQAVERVNQYAGIRAREKVILSIPYPDAGQENFGALSEDEYSLCFSDQAVGSESASRDRFAAVQWFYRNLMDRWSGAGFKNLDLAGIYWYGEAIEKNSGEKELVINTARLVRDNHQFFIWIPYYGTQGYENWRSYGFSHVFLQPNYFAKDSPPEDRMDKSAELAGKYGLGIEIELEESVLHDQSYYDLFYKQLKKGRQLGFDGPLTNAYYAGVVKRTLIKSARSSDPKVRAIYDDLYRWISGAYN